MTAAGLNGHGLPISRLISGGQTGVDRAALDVALELGIPCGGWCPRGRQAEDGVIPARYPLTETDSYAYQCRTEWNVRDSDGTLILLRGALDGGTAVTVELAHAYHRPLRVVALERPDDLQRVRDWLLLPQIRILNVAGPRESSRPGIYQQAVAYLHALFRPGG